MMRNIFFEILNLGQWLSRKCLNTLLFLTLVAILSVLCNFGKGYLLNYFEFGPVAW